MPADDFLDVWACIQGGLFGPHADYMQAIAIVTALETINANQISLHSKSKGKDINKPRDIFPHYMDFAEQVDSDSDDYKAQMMGAKLDGLV